MNEVLPTLVPALGMALLHFLWQGLAVGLLAALVLSLLRNARPQARYAVACLALLACVLLPAWGVVQAFGAGVPGPVAARGALAHASLGAAGGDAGIPGVPVVDALPWIVVLWAAGAGALSLRMAGGWLWVRRTCRQARPDPQGRWQACVDGLAPALGIARNVALRLVESGEGPLTAGWWRPVVLLPVAVSLRMPADLVEALLAHELAHVRRHDYLVNLLQGAAEALLFYHPVTWWLSRRIRVERELVADDLAARALGDRRRLALALSELDRHLGARSHRPTTQYAPAAHGGHLMSRIQHLVRPQPRPPGGTALLPLVGLVLAGAAFYAHARLAPPAAIAAQASTSPARVAEPAVAQQPLPAPTARPGARVLPSPSPAAAARHVVVADSGAPGRDGYALVRAGEEGYTMSGDTSDGPAIEAARRTIPGDFLWFERDGKAWVVRDPAMVAEARAAWAATDALTERMRGIEARMQPHAARMEALGRRMEAITHPEAFETPEVRAAIARMEALGERMAPLVERQAALALRMHGADDGARAALARQQEALAQQQEEFARQMEAHAATMAAASARMALQRAPIEELAREMAAASAPMQAVGKELEALGERMGARSRQADARVRQLVEEAYRSGRAEPAPTQQ